MKVPLMEKWTSLFCHSLPHSTEQNLVKCPEKLYDRDSRFGAKHGADLFALEEYGILFCNLFLQRISSISCSRSVLTLSFHCFG